MSRRRPLKFLFYLAVTVAVLLVVYKIYLNFFERDFSAVHADQIQRIEEILKTREQYSFAVVGNINNSIGIFERKIIPMLNHSGVDFVISAGNAISSGGEDKYRALYRTFQHLRTPYLLTFADNEFGDFGSFRFYEHYGPYVYGVDAGSSHLIFLDTTGKTPWHWQTHWLKRELSNHSRSHTFVFMGRPIRPTGLQTVFGNKDNYLTDPEPTETLLKLFQQYRVDAVFAATLPVFAREQYQGTDYIISGGAGGLVLNDKDSFYHFIKVNVSADKVSIELKPLDIGQHRFFQTMEGLWFFIHSLFYVGYLNFILIVSALLVVAIKLYNSIFIGRDYYPDFEVDNRPFLNKPLRVAMFTNNFLPFIGGVPISIDRLRRGLVQLGHKVLVVAPRYGDKDENDETLLRIPTLLKFGKHHEFRMANPFAGDIRQKIEAFNPNIIHVHHPFWLGRVGLILGRIRHIPVVYTYHTRLEHYAHFVPLPGLLFRNLISHAMIRHFANRCDGVIVPTYSAEEYLRINGVKTPIFIQPTGIDRQHFKDVAPEAIKALKQHLQLKAIPTFISVSRLSREKNIDFMVDALHELKQTITTPFQCLVIGEGSERKRLQKKINELGMGETILLIGAIPQDQMPLYYRLGDLFLFASKSETQGMVILEAMAAGLPVVAVRSSGIEDLVQNDYNGFKTYGDIRQWREQVQRLLEDPELLKRLSTNARKSAEGYSIEEFSQNVAAIYAQLMAMREKHRRY